MAKFITSSLIDAIKGRINGDVFQTWKGIVVRRKGTFPRQPRVALQSRSRSYLSDLSGSYDGLTTGQKGGWCLYADCVGGMSGFNAFIMLNQRLLYSQHPSLTQVNDAPAAPTSPSPVVGASLVYNSGSDRWELSWSTPVSASFYVQAFQSILTGYRDNLYPMWKIANTVGASVQLITIDASFYQSNTFLRVRARVLNTSGEVSAWGTTLEAQKT